MSDTRLRDLCANQLPHVQARIRAAYWFGVSDALEGNQIVEGDPSQDFRLKTCTCGTSIVCPLHGYRTT